MEIFWLFFVHEGQVLFSFCSPGHMNYDFVCIGLVISMNDVFFW